MHADHAPDFETIDPSIQCSRCEAVCCRLTVVVMADDEVPRHFVERGPDGLEVMGRCEDGWCVALDRDTYRCTIYARRPQVCRDVATGGPECRVERDEWRRIALTLR